MKSPPCAPHDVHHHLEVLGRRHDESAHTLDRLGDEGGHLAVGGGPDQHLHVAGAPQLAGRIGQAEIATVAVGGMSMFDERNLGADTAPRGVGGHGLSHEGPSAVGMTQGHDLLAARVELRDHDGRFVSVGATRGEETLFDLSRTGLSQLFGELHHCGSHVKGRGVQEAVDLLLDRPRDLRDAVPQGHGENPAKKVEKLSSLSVFEAQAAPLGDHQRLLIVGRRARPHILFLLLAKLGRFHAATKYPVPETVSGTALDRLFLQTFRP